MKWWRGIFCLQWCCMKSESEYKIVWFKLKDWSIFFSMTPFKRELYIFQMTRKFDILFLIALDPKHIFFLNTSTFSWSFFWIPTFFIMRSCARCRTSGITARSSNPKEQNSFTSLRLNDHSLSNVPFSWTIGTNSVVPYLVLNITPEDSSGWGNYIAYVLT